MFSNFLSVTDKPLDTTDPDLELYYIGSGPELHLTSLETPVLAIDPDPAKWVSEQDFFVRGRQTYATKNQMGVSEVINSTIFIYS